MTNEELESAHRPRDVTDAAGTWLGDALAAHGFGWLAVARSVQRLADGLVQQIVLRPSSSNRTSKLISISTHVTARDPSLRQWRMDHPRLVVPPWDNDVVSVICWATLFPNPVVAESLLDRLINNSHQVFMNGPSYRPNKRPKAPVAIK